MSPEDVARLRELEAKATPGEWYATSGFHLGLGFAVGANNDRGALCVAPCRELEPDSDKHNAALIAAMRNALPVLLDAAEERDRLRARVEVLERALDDFRAWANGFVNPKTGMGSGLHAEMWPMLNPTAAKEMLRRAAEALAAGEEKQDG